MKLINKINTKEGSLISEKLLEDQTKLRDENL